MGTLQPPEIRHQGFVVHKNHDGNGFRTNTAPEPRTRREKQFIEMEPIIQSVSSRSRMEWLKTGARASKADLSLPVWANYFTFLIFFSPYLLNGGGIPFLVAVSTREIMVLSASTCQVLSER